MADFKTVRPPQPAAPEFPAIGAASDAVGTALALALVLFVGVMAYRALRAVARAEPADPRRARRPIRSGAPAPRPAPDREATPGREASAPARPPAPPPVPQNRCGWRQQARGGRLGVWTCRTCGASVFTGTGRPPDGCRSRTMPRPL